MISFSFMIIGLILAIKSFIDFIFAWGFSIYLPAPIQPYIPLIALVLAYIFGIIEKRKSSTSNKVKIAIKISLIFIILIIVFYIILLIIVIKLSSNID
jgi:hypothetical protein